MRSGIDDPGREFLAHLLAGRGREPGEDFNVVDRAVLHAIEAQRIAAGGDDAVELWLAAHKCAVGDVAPCRDLLVEAQAGARRVRLGLNLDLGDPEGDEPAQLFGALGDRRQMGEAEPGLEGGERLFLLVVAVVVAADDKECRAALDRVGRFQIGVVGARHRMIVIGGELALGEPQPDEAVIGAIGDGARQLADGRRVVLRLVFDLGRLPECGHPIRLLLVRRDAVDQLLAPVARRIGQLL